MPRRKTAKNSQIKPWLSRRPDNKEPIFTLVGISLLQCAEFQELSNGAQMCYICMTVASAGKREFEFSRATAQKFGIPDKSLRRHVAELTENGFIITRSSGRNTRSPNTYSFCLKWKEENAINKTADMANM